MRLEFRVTGVAQTKGNMRAFTPQGWDRPIITDANRNLKAWEKLVRDAAGRAIEALPAGEIGLVLDAVRLTVVFVLPRPKSMRRRTLPHTVKPDLDKCVRAIKDALSKVAYRDDAQITELLAMKCYADLAEVPHVDIRVEPAAGVVPAITDQPLFAGMR